MTNPLRPVPDIMEHLTFLLKEGVGAELAPDLGADILDLVEAKLTDYVALPTEHALVVPVLWAAHAWFMDCWSTTPRLLLTSPEPGSGKSNLLKVLECITPFAVRTENTTPAWLYHEFDESRQLNGAPPTLMLDEFDCLMSPGKDNTEIRSIIDAGAYFGGTVTRHMGKNNARFPVYGAMAIAGNMRADQVRGSIRTRSVQIQMQRAGKGHVPKRWYARSSPAEVIPLRAPLLRWSEFVYARAREHRPVLPEEVWSRDADCWEPLIAVADLAGGDWPERARVAAVTAVTAAGVNAQPSEGILLLWVIHGIFDDRKVDKIFTKDLLDELRRTGLFRWANKEPLAAARELSNRLSDYGVRHTRDVRIGKEHLKGYERADFEAAWAAHPEPVTAVTPATTGTETGDE